MADPSLPKTIRTYYQDSYQFTLEGAQVLQVFAVEKPSSEETKDSDEFVVICDQTIFHAQGGGQPTDQGVMTDSSGNKFLVTKVVAQDDVLWHYGTFETDGSATTDSSTPLFQPTTTTTVRQTIDEAQRRLNARIHSAGHLLDVAMIRAGRADLKPSKGYHFPTGAYVEYIGAVETADRPALVEALNQHIKDLIADTAPDDKAVIQLCSYEEADQLLGGGVPSYIPKDSATELRVAKLNAEDPGCPCGGTHVPHVSDIRGVQVTKIQKKSKAVRVSYKVV